LGDCSKHRTIKGVWDGGDEIMIIQAGDEIAIIQAGVVVAGEK